MNAPSLSPPLSTSPASFTYRAILCNLIRQEWYLSRGPVILLATIWLVGLWVLVIFNHPAWLLAIGLCHVLFVSPGQAGRDIIDGTEEFSFALPPGRSPLYLARIVPGLAFLLANGLLGGLAIAYNLPQHLWALCFSGGLTDPFAPVTGGRWYDSYVIAVLLPCAGHAVTVALAANASSRSTVSYAGVLGIIAAASVMAVGFFLESLLWQELNGFIAGPALLATAVLDLLAGHQVYRRKEATGSGGRVGNWNRSGMVWIIASILGLLLCIAASLAWWRFTLARTSHDTELQRIEQQDAIRQQQIQQLRTHPAPTPATTPERDNH